jgi:hypothetical protein
MNDLSNFSESELQNELRRRKDAKKIKNFKVLPFDKERYEKFTKEMKSIIDNRLSENYHEDNDDEHYAYEAAMKLAFGNDIFERLSKINY